ncbi:hypothetical protein POL58_01225 [Nannocystis sp. ncelm1]|uniref:Uncharacterized protein n=1 Tax=Nannocystis radixulma TaxID=2995305 RepID=A0ABT5AWV7_9BACT|nr:hypothetical protein [Nannocystis radixulma]
MLRPDAARAALAAACDRIDAIVAKLPDLRHRESLCMRRPELARMLALARAWLV